MTLRRKKLVHIFVGSFDLTGGGNLIIPRKRKSDSENIRGDFIKIGRDIRNASVEILSGKENGTKIESEESEKESEVYTS